MAVTARFPWVAASAAAAVGVLVAVVLLPIPDEVNKHAGADGLPTLGLMRMSAETANELLAERLAAYDPAPLFIPSAMNSDGAAITAVSHSGGRGPFAELGTASMHTSAVDFSTTVKIPASPIEALAATGRGDGALGLERTDEPEAATVERGGRVEVVAVEGGAVVTRLSLPAEANGAVVEGQPLELLGAVTPAGLLGECVVTVSSGSSEVDEYYHSLLQSKVLIGVRLPVGFYTFRIGL